MERQKITASVLVLDQGSAWISTEATFLISAPSALYPAIRGWRPFFFRDTGKPCSVRAGRLPPEQADRYACRGNWGIHYDGVTREDIEEIVKVTEEMRRQVMEKISLL